MKQARWSERGSASSTADSEYCQSSKSGAFTIPAQFDAIVARHGERTAIGSGDWQPTYAELNAVAEVLADDLRKRAAPGSRIALVQSWDAALVVSVLAVLKAGQSVAVLNPADPPARLRQSLLDIEPALVVPGNTGRDAIREAAVGIPILDLPPLHPLSSEVTRRAASPAAPTLCAPDDLAFLLQTSGSTGGPKWVMQTHQAMLESYRRHDVCMRIQPEDRLLVLGAPTGALALGTMLLGLIHGAAVCPFPTAERGIIGLAEWCRDHEITVLVCSVSAFRHMLKTLAPGEQFPRVRLIRLGSETILGADLHAAQGHFRSDCVCYCSYSSAEAGNLTQFTATIGEGISGFRVPLGKPAEGLEIWLRDEAGRPAQPGAVGELIARGKFLSAGYWRDPARTAQRFSAVDSEGTRDYRTGDLGRFAPDGSLYYVGRVDDMVKIRGNRVILGEVDQAIKSLPGVRESAVVGRTLDDGSARLTAFVVTGGDATRTLRDATAIRAELAPFLSPHAIPGEYHFLDELPLIAHGKIDRAALLARAESADPAREQIETDRATLTELILSGIWKDAFGAAGPSTADFFAAGGDSLSAAIVAAKVRAEFGVELNMLDFAEHARFSDLARRIDQLGRQDSSIGLPPLEPSPERAPYPLSFTQGSIWENSRRSTEAHQNYTLARSCSLRGPLDADALREAMTIVAARNEILRTAFPAVNGKPAQVVRAPRPVELPLIDLSGFPDAHERGLKFLREEAARSLDLERGPLIGHKLIRIAPEEHWLVRVAHHILFDGWSWGLYFQELEAAYRSILAGQAGPAGQQPNPPAGLQYGDYAAWERRVFHAGSPYRVRLVDWWKYALDGTGPLELPWRKRTLTERVARRPVPSDGWLWASLEPSVVARLEDLARNELTTSYVIGLAAFAALVSAAAGRERILVGTYITNRRDVALQHMLGDFARLLPVCLQYDPASTFLEWLASVRKRVVDVETHAQLPREELWKDLQDLGMNPPPVELIFRGTGLALPPKFYELDLALHSHRFPGQGRDRQWPAAMPWGFLLRFDLKKQEDQCELTFDARMYNRRKVHSFLGRYVRLLDQLTVAPQRPMQQILRAIR